MRRLLWRNPAFRLSMPLLTLALAVTFPFWYQYTLVSPFTLCGLPERMKQVEPGMMEDQMWRTLAIPRGCLLGGWGSGGRHHYHKGYRLPYGYNLHYVLDLTHNPAVFMYGEVYRTRWP